LSFSIPRSLLFSKFIWLRITRDPIIRKIEIENCAITSIFLNDELFAPVLIEPFRTLRG
jgi:hypothetical protein